MLNLAFLFHTDITTGPVASKQLKAANDVMYRNMRTVSRDLRCNTFQLGKYATNIHRTKVLYNAQR